MGYSIKATVSCNGECGSCYENAIRSANRQIPKIDSIYKRILEIIREQIKIKESGGQIESAPTFHGGESLLIPLSDLDRLAAKIYGFWGQNNIQTNGLLITGKHIELFKRYNFHVGISLDGDLARTNKGRWNMKNRSDEFIQEKTDLVLSNMAKLKKAGLPMSVIMVMRRYNGLPENLPDTKKFMLRLRNEFDITEARQNTGIVFDEKLKTAEELTATELGAAYCELSDFAFESGLTYQPYMDIVDLMLGYLGQTCTFNDCDPFYTRAEIPINCDGLLTNCLKSGTSQEGIQSMRAAIRSTERYSILKLISQNENGCRDCEYWHICLGGCPGAGVDNDWRNRTRFCESYKLLFGHIYRKLKNMMPNLLLSPDLHPRKPDPATVQHALVAGSAWKKQFRKRPDELPKGKLPTMQDHSDAHGDSHGDRHGDRPHGDHTDYAKMRGKK